MFVLLKLTMLLFAYGILPSHLLSFYCRYLNQHITIKQQPSVLMQSDKVTHAKILPQ